MKSLFFLKAFVFSILVLVLVEASFILGLVVYSSAVTHIAAVELPFFSNDLLEEDIQPIYSFSLYARSVYDQAYETWEDQEIDKVNVASAISPHHLLVAKEIAKLFLAIGSDEVKTVVIVSPNHFSVGRSPAQVSYGTWETPYGELYTNNRQIQELIDAVPVLEREEMAYENEHGIGALTPFIRRSFPKATLVPIIVDESLSQEDRQVLGEAIAKIFPEAVVIASIDMSHNLPITITDFHDDVTLRAIENGERCTPDCLDLEIDSTASLDVLQTINRLRGDEDWTLKYHDNSLEVIPTIDWHENTSHIIGYFKAGDAVDNPFASFHLVGDIMLDRGVRLKMNEFGIDYPWQEMSRFLRGVHVTVGNLEGTVNEQGSTYTYNPPFRFVFSPESVAEMGEYIDIVSQANNHASDVGSAGQVETREWLDELGIPYFGAWAEPVPRYDTTINGFDVTFIGYHQFQPDEVALQEQIEAADSEGRFVIVMPHWGNEYQTAPSSSQERLAQLMVDAGADLIVGGHAHVAQGMEVLDDVVVIYSLGNFIFDQEISATWPALTVGVIIDENNVTIQLLPVYTRGGQPTPMNEAESSALISNIAAASPEYLRQQILNRKLSVTYEK